MKRLLIIPARSGSKRIKDKNIKFFFKKRVIFYSIDTAKKSKLFSKIHISTDSKKYKKIIEKSIKIDFLRPKTLSNGKVPIINVLNHVVQVYEKKELYFDEIWFLSACAPLIDYKDLLKMSKNMKNAKNNNAIIAITEYPAPIQWALKLSKEKNIIPLKKKNLSKRSQDLKKYYYDIGSIMVFKSEVFYSSKKINFKGVIFPRSKSVDVDFIEDWYFMKKLYLKK